MVGGCFMIGFTFFSHGKFNSPPGRSWNFVTGNPGARESPRFLVFSYPFMLVDNYTIYGMIKKMCVWMISSRIFDNRNTHYDFVSWDDEISNIWKNSSKCSSHHQPDTHFPVTKSLLTDSRWHIALPLCPACCLASPRQHWKTLKATVVVSYNEGYVVVITYYLSHYSGIYRV